MCLGVGAVYQWEIFVVRSGDWLLFIKKRPVMAPGEMETVYIKKDALLSDERPEEITISIEEE